MGNDHNRPPKHQVGTAVMPTREAVTKSQLESLHSIIQTLSPFILGQRSIFMLSEEETPRKIDGGAATAAAVTFANVCGKLDDMLNDKSRWDTSAHDKLYESIAKVQDAQVEYLKAQTEGQKVLHRPSVQFHPTVANDGQQFICYYGDIDKPGYAVVGIGATPEEAMLSFDAAFKKGSQEQIILRAADAVDQQQKPKRKPKTDLPPGNLI